MKRDIWNSENMVLSDSAATTTLVGTITNGSDTLSYTYDELGNITSVSENGQLKSTYHYDGKNQLVREDNAGGYTFVYEYDYGGNILNKKEYNYTPADETPDAEHTDSRAVYEYENSEWKDLLTKYNGASIAYDGIGNPLSYYNGWNMTWTDGRRLSAVQFGDGGEESFKYNESRNRISKTRMGEETRYVLNGSSIVCEVKSDGSKLYYFYDEAGSAVGFEYYDSASDTQPDTYYYVKNLQGDVIKLIDKDGNCVVNYSYNTWGVVTVVSDTSTNNLASVNPILYRGYYYDWETGFYYLNSRYYNPEIGRFLNADGALVETGKSIQGYNLFAYCFNNPMNMSDSSGHWPKWATKIAIGVGAVLVGAAVVAATAATGGAAAAFVGAALAGVKAAAISGAIGAAVGAGKSAVSHRISTGSWKGAEKAAFNGAVNGFADGFMNGGIMAGGSQVISSGFKVAAKAGVPTGRNGGLNIGSKVRVLSPNHPKAYEAGGTLLKIGSKYKNIRFDVGAKSLFHMNIQFAKSANYHFSIGIFGSGLWGGLRRD